MILQEWFGLEYPLIQAPMAGCQGADLALAVTRAGGLGSLPCAMLSVENMVEELKRIEATAVGPVNINFFCHTNPVSDPHRDQQWRECLSPYYTEQGLDISAVQQSPGRRSFDPISLEALRVFKPAVLSFHFGLPDPVLLATIKSWGTRVIACATTVAEACWLESQGADAIIAQGLEAGGHRGIFLSEDLTTQMGLFALLPQIVKAVKVPVIAAGGIADENGIAVALRLGASAVQLGTAYLLCPEASTSQIHRAVLQSPAVGHTALTNIFTGRPARGVMNRVMRELGPLCPHAPAFPSAVTLIAPLRTAVEKQGKGDFSPLWCGQNLALQYSSLPAAELTHRLMGLS